MSFAENPYLSHSRIPEPELMEDHEQVEAYAKANFDEAHSMIINHLLNHIPQKFSPSTILDLGAGPGDMTSRLANCFPDARLLAVDGSEKMMLQNKAFITQHYPAGNIGWVTTTIQNFLPESSYEFIFSNSLLHHLNDPFDFWSAIQRSSNENTFIYLCDLIRPESFSKADYIVDKYAREEREVLRSDFYNSLLAAYTIDEIESMIREIRMEQKLKVDQISDRHWICYSKQIH